MHLFLAIVTCVSSFTPKVDPAQVNANIYNEIKLRLVGPFKCNAGEFPILGVELTPEAVENEAVIFSNDTNYYRNSSAEISRAAEGKFSQVTFYDSVTVVDEFNVKFNYSDPVPTTTTRLQVKVICGTIVPEKKIIQNSRLLMPKQPLDIAVVEPPYPNQPIALNPAEVKGSQVTNVSITFSWPKFCTNSKKPTVRLSIDKEPLDAGAALSSDLTTNYTIYGLNGPSSTVILGPRSPSTIASEKFNAIEFVKSTTFLPGVVTLNFKYLAQLVPSATHQSTTINVDLICNGKTFKSYTKPLNNGPILKVNSAKSPSFTLSTLILTFTISFGFM